MIILLKELVLAIKNLLELKVLPFSSILNRRIRKALKKEGVERTSRALLIRLLFPYKPKDNE